MKKIFFLICIITLFSGKCFAYYSVEQMKYEQSIGSTETYDRAIENPQQFNKMYDDYNQKNNNYEYQNNYNNQGYVEERPLYKFGNSSQF